MEHEIVVRRAGAQSVTYTGWGQEQHTVNPPGRNIEVCANCGCSRRYIEHTGRTECRHQSEGE